MSTDSGGGWLWLDAGDIATWVERAEMAERRALDAERECGYLRRELDALRGTRLDPRAAERRALVIAEAVRDFADMRRVPWAQIEDRVDAAIAAYEARAKEAK